MTASSTEASRPRRRRRRRPEESAGPGTWAAVGVIALTALALPLMMGNRTPYTLTATLLVLVSGALLAGILARLPLRGRMAPPPTSWLIVFAVFSVVVLFQVLPWPWLAETLGPYPDTLRFNPEFELRHWSPNVGATLRAWAAFVALFTLAWIAFHLNPLQRNVLWLLLAGMAVFQAIYGIAALASGSDSIFGIWPRNNPGSVHGSFSNRNLFAAYLALLLPMVAAVWWIRGMPLLARLPSEIKVAGSLIAAAIVGTAMFASTSRLGAVAGLAGVLIGLLLWSRHRRLLQGHSVWPAYLVLAGTLTAALWYGVMPLAERLAATDIEDYRFVVVASMLTEFPASWYLHGVGLGGFEAAFKQIQPGDSSGWWDYAHNDLLQWLIEMGIIGAAILLAIIAGLLRAAHLNIERIPLYAGLAALSMVALGDFSWHIPGTQIVLALYIGTLLRRSHTQCPPTGTGSVFTHGSAGAGGRVAPEAQPTGGGSGGAHGGHPRACGMIAPVSDRAEASSHGTSPEHRLAQPDRDPRAPGGAERAQVLRALVHRALGSREIHARTRGRRDAASAGLPHVRARRRQCAPRPVVQPRFQRGGSQGEHPPDRRGCEADDGVRRDHAHRVHQSLP